jgi:hypothetical protein
MRIFLFLVLLFIATKSKCQISDRLVKEAFLPYIESATMKKRILFFKAKTDNFLLTHSSKLVKNKFQFSFPSCTFGGSYGCRGRNGYPQFTRSREDTNVVDVINNYQFIDKSIKLEIQNIEVYYDDEHGTKLHFNSCKDSLFAEALKKIYSKGYLVKIMNKVKESGLTNYATIIETFEATQNYTIIVKDRNLSHNWYIQ